jgi:hypothetical protein
MIDLSGYRIERTDEPGILGYAYRIFGPRGTEFALIRNKVNLHRMFVVNTKTMNPNARIKGYGWWTDKDGELRPLR